MVDAGRLGRIVYAAGHVPWFRTQAYYGQGGWRGTWKFDGGGALMNQGIHTVDLLQWMVGAKVRRVAAMTALLGHTGLEVEDVAAAVLQFEGGAIGMLFASTALWPGLPARIELGGTGGTIVADAAGLKVLQFAKPEPADERVLQEFGRIAADTGVADPKAISPECHRRVFADFLAALDAGGEPELSAAEARKAVEIVLAVYRSAKTGQAVDLPLAE
jgi:predicted dehydrogenase